MGVLARVADIEVVTRALDKAQRIHTRRDLAIKHYINTKYKPEVGWCFGNYGEPPHNGKYSMS